ncbi:chorismate-binding protein [Polaribacter septentrionalilitoris]|uniref:chorismate-binding protein n=1 Tax=Polaribacter septentrionalilitoris TaxID=2494657 RepID=UPI001F1746BA|nr:chorismate-binding protein [Polaribacter septentrionalilitoris]
MFNEILHKIKDSHYKNLPFVAYRKPNSDELSALFMESNALRYTEDFSENGFVFSPFDANEKTILFPLKEGVFLTEHLNLEKSVHLQKSLSEEVLDKDFHISLVKKTIEKITTSNLEKIVISRKEALPLVDFNFLKTFIELLKNYKNAFVYVWFHPEIGLWLGASPETLLNIKNRKFETMSLAGTQVYQNTNTVTWGKKELEEQQLVTDFIKNQLQSISSALKIDKTKTVKAGNLLHLKTNVKGELNNNASLASLIRGLHPTPAVCGLPRNLAKDFILENENYHRSFYTGFLGELNFKNQQSSLFVNLRCMQISDTIASIYIGGGITKESIPEKEFQETVSKAKTMKNVL